MFWLYSVCHFTPDIPHFLSNYLVPWLVCFEPPHKVKLFTHQMVLGVWSSTRTLLTYQGLYYRRKTTLPYQEANVMYICGFSLFVFCLVWSCTSSGYGHNHYVYSSACPPHMILVLQFQELCVHTNITNSFHITIFVYFTCFSIWNWILFCKLFRFRLCSSFRFFFLFFHGRMGIIAELGISWDIWKSPEKTGYGQGYPWEKQE